jgi:hypothetical protein
LSFDSIDFSIFSGEFKKASAKVRIFLIVVSFSASNQSPVQVSTARTTEEKRVNFSSKITFMKYFKAQKLVSSRFSKTV